MIRYRTGKPDDTGRPVVEASPKDIDRFRPLVRAFLRRSFFTLGSDDIEDTTQQVMIVACCAASEGAILGRRTRSPEDALRAWLVKTARLSAMNWARAERKFVAVIEVRAEGDGVDGRSLPDAVVEARRMLAVIARERDSVELRTLLRIARGWKFREVAREMGVATTTVLKRVQRARRRLVGLRDEGQEEEMRPAEEGEPGGRKRGR